MYRETWTFHHVDIVDRKINAVLASREFSFFQDKTSESLNVWDDFNKRIFPI